MKQLGLDGGKSRKPSLVPVGAQGIQKERACVVSQVQPVHHADPLQEEVHLCALNVIHPCAPPTSGPAPNQRFPPKAPAPRPLRSGGPPPFEWLPVPR